MATYHAHSRQRRTATSVCAGAFDSRRPYERDVLTSVLNGVPKYPAGETVEDDDQRRARRQEKRKEREQIKKKAKPVPKHVEKAPPVASTSASASAVSTTTAKRSTPTPRPQPTTSAFWIARPVVQISTLQRSISVTPPPPSSPPSTPGPSVSSGTSRTSSKRPHTPDDDEDIDDLGRSRSRSLMSSTPPPKLAPRPRKKRTAARKGWKGWVEGSPPPSDKLINLDVVTVLTERKTRSGKNFDGASEQKDYWI
ncbi:hypothetical protein EIP86_002665 [Pleurotus ostreatoroseus]|nr:hypothetical protein EIP86_002665 [Pleurotus ostreatoroseus]